MRIIRLKEVIGSTGLARSTIYKYIGEGTFPKPVSLGERSVGWIELEVHDWIMARISERDLAQCRCHDLLRRVMASMLWRFLPGVRWWCYPSLGLIGGITRGGRGSLFPEYGFHIKRRCSWVVERYLPPD